MGRRTRTARIAAAAAVAIVMLAGCSGGGGSSSSGGGGGGGNGDGPTQLTVAPGGDPNPERTDVKAVNFRFEDAEFTTTAGSTVWWVNEGSAPHTVTSDLFDSGTIRTGNGFSYTFDEPGEYAYWCKNHPGMEGTIIVE
jgi:plastocyanin